jgi:hypothetical protein
MASALRDRLLSAIDEGLLAAIQPMIEGAELPREIEPNLRTYLESKIAAVRELAGALGEPEDEAELYRSVAFLWLELKFEWVRFNQVMQYQTVRDGQASPLVFAKGSACADVLAKAEAVLSPRDVSTLTDISAEPLRFGRPDLDRIRRFLAHHEGTIARIDRLMLSASSAYEGLVDVAAKPDTPEPLKDRITGLVGRYEDALSAIHDDVCAILSMDLGLAWEEIAARIEGMAEELGRRVQVTLVAAPGQRIDSRLLAVLRDVVLGSAQVLLTAGAGTDERHARGLPLHDHVVCELEEVSGGHRCVVRHDAVDLPAKLNDDAALRGVFEALRRSVPEGAVEVERIDHGALIATRLPSVGGFAIGELLVLEAQPRPLAVRTAWVESIRSAARSAAEIDLHDASRPGLVVSLAPPGGARVVLRVDAIGPSVRSVVLPATTEHVTAPWLYDGVIRASARVLPVLGERFLRKRAAAETVPSPPTDAIEAAATSVMTGVA